VKTYWTSAGSGVAEPDPELDVVGGTIVVEVEPGAEAFRVSHSEGTAADVYPTWGASTPPLYAWSVRSTIYHYFSCRIVRTISPPNLRTGDTPPEGRRLHTGCPSPLDTAPDGTPTADPDRAPM
jgi:hypothetical protein